MNNVTTYTATAPNGQVFTRKSKRAYTHAAVIASTDGSIAAVISFHSSKELAAKAANDRVDGFRKGAMNPKCTDSHRAYCAANTAKWTTALVVETKVA